MIRSTIFMTISLSESKKSINGFDFFSEINNSNEIPTNRAKEDNLQHARTCKRLKNITWKYIYQCLQRACVVLSSCLRSVYLTTPAEFSYFVFIFSMVSADIPSPGFTTFTIPNPMTMATTVVKHINNNGSSSPFS